MSWHFLQGQEAASWEGNCLDGAPSALLSLIPTPAESCLHDRPTVALTDSRSGMTCGPSTANRGAGTSMSSAEASHVRTSARLAKGPESSDQDPVCGPRWHELSARFDLATFSWKTARSLFPEVLPWSSVILPRWGMMRDGECWERSTPELPINGIGFGLWPTPVADGDRTTNYAQGGTSLGWAVRNVPTPTASMLTVGDMEQARYAGNGGKRPKYQMANQIPTPTVHGNYNRKGASKNSGNGLATWVRQVPTPTCHDRKGKSGAKRGKGATGGPCLTMVVGGTLNPMWVEWLMGWPLGWTDCAVSETDKCQQWLSWHGKF